MQISILGSAITQFGELWNKSLDDLTNQAISECLLDANLDQNDHVKIEAVFIANKAAGNFSHQHHLNALVSQYFSHLPPAMRIEGACASGSLAMLAAEYALLAGRYKTVMVVGAEKMTDVTAGETTQILSGAAHVEDEYGSTFPALYSLVAQAHIAEFGTTLDHLAAVSVKNHRHALDNPHAQFRKKITLEDVSRSAVVASPLRMLDCSPISDGAAAVILTTDKVGKGSPVVLGMGHGQDTLDLASRESLTSFRSTREASRQAFAEAGLTAKDIQVAEVHDCFTIAELVAIEDLGFFAKGDGGLATESGKTTYSGQVVINPSGGLKAGGHPVGATGVKQIAYLAKLLEEEKFERALAHNVGGSGATAVVHVLGRNQ